MDMEFSKHDRVTVVEAPGSVLNDAMKDWIRDHDGKTFTVERVVKDDDGSTAVKLHDRANNEFVSPTPRGLRLALSRLFGWRLP